MNNEPIWKSWFARHGAKLLLFARQQSRRPDEAEDLVRSFPNLLNLFGGKCNFIFQDFLLPFKLFLHDTNLLCVLLTQLLDGAFVCFLELLHSNTMFFLDVFNLLFKLLDVPLELIYDGFCSCSSFNRQTLISNPYYYYIQTTDRDP